MASHDAAFSDPPSQRTAEPTGAVIVHALSALAGALLVLVVIADAVGTLVVTQGRSAPWRPTRIWYTTTWRATRAIASRLPFEGGEATLSLYPAASLLGLLVLWLAGLMVGW